MASVAREFRRIVTRKSKPAPGGSAGFCFDLRPLGLGSSLKGALQESIPWHWGAGFPSRPSGRVP
jgi:hypothetical protein